MKKSLVKFSDIAAYNAGKSDLSDIHVVKVSSPQVVVYLNKFNGHDYVDLGLPSGTLWATMNIGATGSGKTDHGDYFYWGDIRPYRINGVIQNYRFLNESYELTKYNDTDGKITLDLEDDAAHVLWGGDWHIPTKAQVDELRSNCNINGNGLEGAYRLTSKVDSSKSIIIPGRQYGNAYTPGMTNYNYTNYITSNQLYYDTGTESYLTVSGGGFSSLSPQAMSRGSGSALGKAWAFPIRPVVG